MSRLTSRLAACLALCVPGSASAGQSLTLMLSAAGGSAEIVFHDDMKATDAFTIRLIGLVAPGSRIRISIDRAKAALTDRIIQTEDCNFGLDPAVCLVQITGGSPEFVGLVQAFKAGLVSHLDITNPGSKSMTSDTSLAGFTKAFDAL
jgi:hypothetical protein